MAAGSFANRSKGEPQPVSFRQLSVSGAMTAVWRVSEIRLAPGITSSGPSFQGREHGWDCGQKKPRSGVLTDDGTGP